MVIRWLRELTNLRKRLLRRVELEGPSDRIDDAKERTLLVYESELRALGADAVHWRGETGGDLFGLWSGTPIVYLATQAGPGAVRETAHFRLDVGYLRELSVELATNWGLRYFGDWHSHHRLGLKEPSGGDRSRIVRLGDRNDFSMMAEIIVTLSSENPPIVEVHAYGYRLPSVDAFLLELVVLDGVSPVREALLARDWRPEQKLESWLEFPIERLRINGGGRGQQLQPSPARKGFASEMLLQQVQKSLEEASQRPLEVYETEQGFIVAVPTDDNALVGIAFDNEWPCPVLEIDWIDRSTRTAEPILSSPGVDALVPGRIVSLYEDVLRKRRE